MSKPQYLLSYWPLPFRSCFVSYLFAYVDVPLAEETEFEEIQRIRNMSPAQQDVPFMGPPILRDIESTESLSQMPAIVLYVSRKLGLTPKGSFQEAMSLKIIMDCNDVLMEICRYNGSMMWERDTWHGFRSKRLPRWMKIFEESLNRKYIGGNEVNFADIGTYALFGNMQRCLPELEADLMEHAPGIHALCKRIGEKESLAQFVQDQEKKYGKLYCDGQIEESIRRMLKSDDTA